MSHMTNTKARVEITTVNIEGALTVHLTQHFFGTYVDARGYVARYLADNGLRRVSYGDAAPLFRDGERVGHYSITRA